MLLIHCAELNIFVPGQLSVIGFDDLPFAAVASTPLTTVHVPKQEMGRIVADRLMKIIRGATAAAKIQVSTTFVERESVRTLR